MTFDELKDAYEDQVRGLIDGGVDLLLLETIFDTLNAKAAHRCDRRSVEERGTASATAADDLGDDHRRSGRTLSGQTVDAFWVSIAHAQPFSVGINCALGARDMRPYLAELARIADCYVSCYPNAGLPNAFGQYDEQPDDTGGYLAGFAASGFVNIVGGCCGTTPEHIAAIAEARSGEGPPRTAQRRARAVHAVLRARDADDPARLELSDDRRADQRHRLDRDSRG